MAQSVFTKPWMQKLIMVIIGIVLTVLGGYFIGTVISTVLKAVDQTMLLAGIIMLVIGVVLLWIILSKMIRKPGSKKTED